MPLLRYLQSVVPKLRDGLIIERRLDIFWRTMMTEGRVENTDNTVRFKSLFNAYIGWRDPNVPEKAYSSEAG